MCRIVRYSCVRTVCPSADRRLCAVCIRDVETNCGLVKVSLYHNNRCRSYVFVVSLVERCVQVVRYGDCRVSDVDFKRNDFTIVYISREITGMNLNFHIITIILCCRNRNIPAPTLIAFDRICAVIYK